MKKILCTLLACLLLLALMIPAGVFAADTETTTELFDPASSDTKEGRLVQFYILYGLTAVSLIIIAVVAIKNIKDSKKQ